MWIEAGPIPVETVRAEVARVAPRFSGSPVAFLGEGMDSRAYLVEADHVFGFAKHADAALGLDRQAAILPRVAPGLPLAVPRLDYFGRVEATGLPFVGYPLIRGIPFDRAVFEGLPAGSRDRALADLAGFFRALHAFPVDRAEALGAWRGATRSDYARDLESARSAILPRLDGDDRARVDAALSAFVAEDAHFARPACLLHGDIWPEHVLFDPGAGRIVGVIDFADVSIGDSDYDLAFLATRLGPAFLGGLIPHLDHPDPTRLAGKLEAIALFNAIEDATVGLERGDAELVETALEFLVGRGPMRTG